MNISPDAIMWSFAIIIGCITTIIGIIVSLIVIVWKQQGKRIQKVEEDAYHMKSEILAQIKRIFSLFEISEKSNSEKSDKYQLKDDCCRRIPNPDGAQV